MWLLCMLMTMTMMLRLLEHSGKWNDIRHLEDVSQQLDIIKVNKAERTRNLRSHINTQTHIRPDLNLLIV